MVHRPVGTARLALVGRARVDRARPPAGNDVETRPLPQLLDAERRAARRTANRRARLPLDRDLRSDRQLCECRAVEELLPSHASHIRPCLFRCDSPNRQHAAQSGARRFGRVDPAAAHDRKFGDRFELAVPLSSCRSQPRLPCAAQPRVGGRRRFIPLANLWKPYQSLRDLLPPRHPLRGWSSSVGSL